MNNEHEGDKIQKEYEHYANDPRSFRIVDSMKRWAKQGPFDNVVVSYENFKQQHDNQLDEFECVTLTLINILVEANHLTAAN